MKTWKDVKEKITSKKLSSKTWGSDQINLLKVIQGAEVAGVNAETAYKAPMSNLRTIIKPAKKAIKSGDHEKLRQLFDLASSLPNRELKFRIGSAKIETIYFKVSRNFIEIKVDPKQFKKISSQTRQYFTYKEKSIE